MLFVESFMMPAPSNIKKTNIMKKEDNFFNNAVLLEENFKEDPFLNKIKPKQLISFIKDMR